MALRTDDDFERFRLLVLTEWVVAGKMDRSSANFWSLG